MPQCVTAISTSVDAGAARSKEYGASSAPGRKAAKPRVRDVSCFIAGRRRSSPLRAAELSYRRFFFDPARDRGAVRIVELAERARNTFTVLRRAVLTHFPFADELADRQLDADDGAELLFDKSRGRVGPPPRRLAAGLEALGQPRHQAAQPFGILNDFL